jgi:hypothetical protein
VRLRKLKFYPAREVDDLLRSISGQLHQHGLMVNHAGIIYGQQPVEVRPLEQLHDPLGIVKPFVPKTGDLVHYAGQNWTVKEISLQACLKSGATFCWASTGKLKPAQ